MTILQDSFRVALQRVINRGVSREEENRGTVANLRTYIFIEEQNETHLGVPAVKVEIAVVVL